jgi:hypothetical protein
MGLGKMDWSLLANYGGFLVGFLGVVLILQRKVALLRKVGHDYVILRLRRCDGRRPSRARVRLRCEQ